MPTKREKEIKKGEIIIYKSKSGPRLGVRLEQETVWLTQAQMAELFEKNRKTITEHIRNVFKEGELIENSVCRKFQHTASDGKVYDVNFYNLDVIISVGYRVKSYNGTQFRIWATKTLKQHLINGFTINKKRLSEAREKFRELQETIAFLQEKSKHELLVGQEQEILSLLANYSKTFTLLDQYDKEKLTLVKKTKGKFILDYGKSRSVIDKIKKSLMTKKEASDLFGQENQEKFKAILGNIYQTFGGKELYSSLEEKAAHLLYFIIKDHPFIDGNKRSASCLFVYFLDKNAYLYRESGEKKINDNALTALTLLIAVSDPKEKDKMIKIITNLLIG